MPDTKKTLPKRRVNFVIDALMLLCLAALAGIGFLLEFDLGKGRWREWIAQYGLDTKVTFLGLIRPRWETIHLYFGLAFILLVVLHIVFHWNVIPGLYRRLIGGRTSRWIAGPLFVGVSVVLLLFSFFVEPKLEYRELGTGDFPVDRSDVDATAPAEFHLDVGVDYVAQGRHVEALEQFDWAIRLVPDMAEAYLLRAEVWIATGQPDRGVSDLKKVIQLSEDADLVSRARSLIQEHRQ